MPHHSTTCKAKPCLQFNRVTGFEKQGRTGISTAHSSPHNSNPVLGISWTSSVRDSVFYWLLDWSRRATSTHMTSFRSDVTKDDGQLRSGSILTSATTYDYIAAVSLFPPTWTSPPPKYSVTETYIDSKTSNSQFPNSHLKTESKKDNNSVRQVLKVHSTSSTYLSNGHVNCASTRSPFLGVTLIKPVI